MLQLAHSEVAKPKLGALRPQFCQCSFSELRSEPRSRTDSGMRCGKRAPLFANVSNQTRFDPRSMAQRPIKVGIKGRGMSGTSRGSNPADLCCSSPHLVQCEPDEPSSFTNPNVGPDTDAGL